MGLLNKEILIRKEDLYNLTDEVLFVYAHNGKIVRLPRVALFEKRKEGYYIVGDKGECRQNVPPENLVIAKSAGIGRGGFWMTRLFSAWDKSYRVYPLGE